jgi:thiamine-phosphate pyrophosphorylase
MKGLRHSLAAVVALVDRGSRLTLRNTATDVGTTLSLPPETQRQSMLDVVVSAAERTTQSLRCLEEFGKLIDPLLGQRFKQLRYAAYDQLAAAELRLASDTPIQRIHLYLLIDCGLDLESFTAHLQELADAGVDCFQLRDKQVEGRVLMQYARCAVSALEGKSASVIVNDRVDVALASGAAGVHLGQTDMDIADARRIAGNKLWIGVSTHDLQQAVMAESAGADYIGCGPTFPSPTKQFQQFPGVDFIRQACSTVAIPCFAIGGISEANLEQVMHAGCRQIAVSSAILGSEQPVATAQRLKMGLLKPLP